ncbi:hypothetical protein D9M71_222300 [compost metagenome]
MSDCMRNASNWTNSWPATLSAHGWASIWAAGRRSSPSAAVWPGSSVPCRNSWRSWAMPSNGCNNSAPHRKRQPPRPSSDWPPPAGPRAPVRPSWTGCWPANRKPPCAKAGSSCNGRCAGWTVWSRSPPPAPRPRPKWPACSRNSTGSAAGTQRRKASWPPCAAATRSCSSRSATRKSCSNRNSASRPWSSTAPNCSRARPARCAVPTNTRRSPNTRRWMSRKRARLATGCVRPWSNWPSPGRSCPRKSRPWPSASNRTGTCSTSPGRRIGNRTISGSSSAPNWACNWPMPLPWPPRASSTNSASSTCSAPWTIWKPARPPCSRPASCVSSRKKPETRPRKRWNSSSST